MSNKKRVKKNSNVLRKRRLAKAFTSTLGIARINENNCEIVDLTKNELYKSPTRTTISMFTDSPHKWVILLVCLCESDTGRYMKTEEIRLASPYYQRDLVEFLQSAQGDLAKACNQNHLQGLGWIASTNDITYDLEQAEVLLEKLGAWSQ